MHAQNQPAVTMFGAQWCGDCRRTKRQLDDHGVAFEYRDVERDDVAKLEAIRISGKQSIPVVLFSDGTHLVEPSGPALAEKLRALELLA